jgi:hypothetical protein
VSAGVALTPPPNFGERLRAADLLIAEAPKDCAASRIAAAAVAETRTPAFGAGNTSAISRKVVAADPIPYWWRGDIPGLHYFPGFPGLLVLFGGSGGELVGTITSGVSDPSDCGRVEGGVHIVPVRRGHDRHPEGRYDRHGVVAGVAGGASDDLEPLGVILWPVGESGEPRVAVTPYPGSNPLRSTDKPQVAELTRLALDEGTQELLDSLSVSGG